MIKLLPSKRTFILVHRWLGIYAVVFLVSISITGIVLNHTETLRLNDIRISHSWIMERYGMASADDVRSFRIDETTTFSWIDGQLYVDGDPFLETARPVGALKTEMLTVIGTERELILLTPTNDLVESISGSALPYDTLESLGTDAAGMPVLDSGEALWQPDSSWLQFSSYTGQYAPVPLEPAFLEAASLERILTHYQGEGMTLYRVLLDLHSGRLFGWGGRTLMDLTAIAILILIATGVGGWFRKSRNRFRIG